MIFVDNREDCYERIELRNGCLTALFCRNWVCWRTTKTSIIND